MFRKIYRNISCHKLEIIEYTRIVYSSINEYFLSNITFQISQRISKKNLVNEQNRILNTRILMYGALYIYRVLHVYYHNRKSVADGGKHIM